MRAVRFHGPGTDLTVEDVSDPVPGPEEVVVRVAACGLCGSDVHFLEDVPVPAGLPITLGHEPSGVVETVGTDVVGWAPGDRVAFTLGAGCGKCPTCASGHPTSCASLLLPGIHVDGAFAEKMRVRADALVAVPDGVSMAAAAVATDCVATPFHALRCTGKLCPGERVAVIGAGGLGTQAVGLARHLGAATIVVADVSEAALERIAPRADATVLITPGRDPGPEIAAAAGGGVELALECVGVPDAVTAGLQSLIPGGRLVLVGIGMSPPPIPLPQALFCVWEVSVLGAFGSHREDLEEVLRLAAESVIDIDASISHRVSLDDVPRGLEMLRTKEGNPQRIVMEP